MARSGRRRAAAGAGGTGNGAPAAADEGDRIIEAAFARIASDGWLRLSLASVADMTEVPILQVYRRFRSKRAILCRFFERIDETVLAEPPAAEEGERPRDRLFDLIMRRFDALRPYKEALGALRRELPRDPPSAMIAGAALCRSMRWMLEAADIVTGGVRGAVATKLTAGAYLAVMQVWQRDDAPDLARTMAALDARLQRIERWLEPLAPARAAGGRRSA
jgi:AcrR family transcriptional regulator